MEKPKIENYKLGKGFHTHNFVSDLTLYTDQLEAEIETHSLKNESKLRVLLSNKIESLKSENKELTEALKDLMKGVDNLPPLTAIQGVLTKQYKRAEKAIQGNN